MAYSIFNSGDIVMRVFGNGAALFHVEDRDGYWLRTFRTLEGYYWLPISTLMNLDSIVKELCSIRDAMILYCNASVIFA
jgi:hypothetical protein